MIIHLICILCFQANACVSAHMLGSVFSFASCSVTWEMEQTMTNMTGNIVDKPNPCLANQPVNMSDAVAYSLHSAAGHTKDQAAQIIWLCHRKPTHFCQRCRCNAFTIRFIVMLTEVEKRNDGENSTGFLSYISNPVDFESVIIPLFAH